jgi:urease subunit gamma/beta
MLPVSDDRRRGVAVYVSQTEEDRLRVFTAAELARRNLAKGLKLNEPEAVALACDEMHLAARSGATYEDVIASGRAAVPSDRLIDGVAELVPEVRLEVLLEEGTRLIVLRSPWE